jgi:hypothetical protein
MTLASRILAKKTRLVLEKDALSVVAIMNGIASPRKIARRILQNIGGELGFEPKLESVAKIVERYVNEVEKSGKLSGYDVEAINRIIAKTHVILQSDIAIIVMRISRNVGKILMRIIQLVYSGEERPFINVTFSHSYVTIIIDQCNMEKAVKVVGKNLVYKKRNQAAICVITPKEVMNVTGYTGHLLSIMGLGGVNMSEILSSYNEGIIISNEKDAQKAYDVLRAEIERMRKRYAKR